MDTLGAYGSSDDSVASSSSENRPAHAPIAATIKADHDESDESPVKKIKTQESTLQFPGLLLGSVSAPKDSLLNVPFLSAQQPLEELHRTFLETTSSATTDTESKSLRMPRATTLSASLAQSLDKQHAHDFCNPLFMEQTIDSLGIDEPLGSNAFSNNNDMERWETTILQREEQARQAGFQQQQQQQEQNPIAVAYAQDQLLQAVSQNNSQGIDG